MQRGIKTHEEFFGWYNELNLLGLSFTRIGKYRGARGAFHITENT